MDREDFVKKSDTRDCHKIQLQQMLPGSHECWFKTDTKLLYNIQMKL